MQFFLYFTIVASQLIWFDLSEIVGKRQGTSTVLYVRLCSIHLCRLWSWLTALTMHFTSSVSYRHILTFSFTQNLTCQCLGWIYGRQTISSRNQRVGCRSKNRRDSDKGQIVMASSGENLLIVVQWGKNHKPATECWTSKMGQLWSND